MAQLCLITFENLSRLGVGTARGRLPVGAPVVAVAVVRGGGEIFGIGDLQTFGHIDPKCNLGAVEGRLPNHRDGALVVPFALELGLQDGSLVGDVAEQIASHDDLGIRVFFE